MSKPKLNIAEAGKPLKQFQMMIVDKCESSTFFESFPAINAEMALKAARHTYKGNYDIKLTGMTR